MTEARRKKAFALYTAVIALTGLAMGLSDSVLANYYKDAYNTGAFARGLIELPRELPGVLCVVIVSAFAFFGDIRLAALAQALAAFGLTVLGAVTPRFGVMLVFLFIFSLGQHIFMPLSDSIGLALAEEGKAGKALGRLNGARTAFSMAAGVIVFIGFRAGFFSFFTPVKVIFLIAAAIFAAIFVLLARLRRIAGEKTAGRGRFRVVLRSEYGVFYLLASLYGARKQIMLVYGPWVLIELMGFGADNMALLAIAGAGAGIFFMPAVGRWIDRFGTARLMLAEAACFLVIYTAYGVLSARLSSGALAVTAAVAAAGFAVNMADRMSAQFGMVRAVYLRSVAVTPSDITPTLSLGMALDHVLSIAGALLCGWLWREAGPQYVFLFAGALSLCNMAVALTLTKRKGM
ncbi:MAG: MFS transporter [Oscillospiraceae bacterium]|jgi:predicted MFS family arabinose efflux permease|nr:MFS transporter [Oscillospiraceae bacterium]